MRLVYHTPPLKKIDFLLKIWYNIIVHFVKSSQISFTPLGGTMEAPTHSAATEQSPAAQVKAFTDKGQFRKARELAEDIEREAGADPEGPELDAEFWFQYALANQLTGRSGEMQYMRAAVASGFSAEMSVDMKRDTILHMVRTGRAEEAQYLVEQLQLESSDVGNNRWLASVMTEGRVHYALGDFNEAFERFEEAALGWLNLGTTADKQWQQNNLFWLYKTTMITGERSSDLASQGLSQPRLEARVGADPRQLRRLTVWFGDHFGKVGIRTLDLGQALWFRLHRHSR